MWCEMMGKWWSLSVWIVMYGSRRKSAARALFICKARRRKSRRCISNLKKRRKSLWEWIKRILWKSMVMWVWVKSFLMVWCLVKWSNTLSTIARVVLLRESKKLRWRVVTRRMFFCKIILRFGVCIGMLVSGVMCVVKVWWRICIVWVSVVLKLCLWVSNLWWIIWRISVRWTRRMKREWSCSLMWWWNWVICGVVMLRMMLRLIFKSFLKFWSGKMNVRKCLSAAATGRISVGITLCTIRKLRWKIWRCIGWKSVYLRIWWKKCWVWGLMVMI